MLGVSGMGGYWSGGVRVVIRVLKRRVIVRKVSGVGEYGGGAVRVVMIVAGVLVAKRVVGFGWWGAGGDGGGGTGGDGCGRLRVRWGKSGTDDDGGEGVGGNGGAAAVHL